MQLEAAGFATAAAGSDWPTHPGGVLSARAGWREVAAEGAALGGQSCRGAGCETARGSAGGCLEQQLERRILHKQGAEDWKR